MESTFPLLHERLRQWVWQKQWQDLHPVQNAAIPPILAADRDVLIGAATAAGKTEAAFLPICSTLLDDPCAAGIRVLYVSPLKALINDQFRRVDELCEGLDIPTHRWHGDVSAARKLALLKSPSGILLTTPESLEGMFVLRGTRIPALFAGLRYVVVDELHSFLGADRGVQLMSLLHRLDTAVRRRVPRIGLSATIGDMAVAATQLRPGSHFPMEIVSVEQDSGQELLAQLRAYMDPRLEPDQDEPSPASAVRRISEHLFSRLRGRTNLVFANSRNDVERYTVELARLSQQAGVPTEFHPHHGNLSKELREDVESMLRDTSRAATAVCTTTLEMGIDIGDIEQVAQIGPPSSVASLRQRLGRSGRRPDTSATLRAYVSEIETDANTSLLDRLHPRLLQTTAVIDLLLRPWFEPPESGSLHLSVLIQQLLSLIAQHGGVSPAQAFRVLCAGDSPFAGMATADFATLLRDLGERDVITQAHDGSLLLGDRGEITVNHYSFYAIFPTAEEYRLVSDGRTLGTMPVDFPLYEGLSLVFAGRRWCVMAVREADRLIELLPSSTGKPILAGAGNRGVHSTVRQRMREILEEDAVPRYLDATAASVLAQARRAYADANLDTASVVQDGTDALLFTWTGDKQGNTLAIMLNAAGLETDLEGFALRVAGVRTEAVLAQLVALVSASPPDPIHVAKSVINTELGKYDSWIGSDLLTVQYASRMIDCTGAFEVAQRILSEQP